MFPSKDSCQARNISTISDIQEDNDTIDNVDETSNQSNDTQSSFFSSVSTSRKRKINVDDSHNSDGSLAQVIKLSGLKPHIKELLRLYGIETYDDLKFFTLATIDKLETMIQNNGFYFAADLTCRSEQQRYLGRSFDQDRLQSFKFSPVEREKLEMLPAIIKEFDEKRIKDNLKRHVETHRKNAS